MELRLKEVVKLYNKDQKEICKKVGITEQSFSGYNSGNINPPIKKLQLIADAVGCNVLELFEPGKGYGHFYDGKTWEGIRRF